MIYYLPDSPVFSGMNDFSENIAKRVYNNNMFPKVFKESEHYLFETIIQNLISSIFKIGNRKLLTCFALKAWCRIASTDAVYAILITKYESGSVPIYCFPKIKVGTSTFDLHSFRIVPPPTHSKKSFWTVVSGESEQVEDLHLSPLGVLPFHFEKQALNDYPVLLQEIIRIINRDERIKVIFNNTTLELGNNNIEKYLLFWCLKLTSSCTDGAGKPFKVNSAKSTGAALILLYLSIKNGNVSGIQLFQDTTVNGQKKRGLLCSYKATLKYLRNLGVVSKTKVSVVEKCPVITTLMDELALAWKTVNIKRICELLFIIN